MSDWNEDISQAPRDGRKVRLGWLNTDGTVEHEVVSRWCHGKWEGNWTPTHWKLESPQVKT